MGKRSGITKGGRVMNPADRERKVQRAKELKRNKKQRTAVRQAIVKSRDPEEIIEQMSRLDDQEFDLHRQLSLNVIQEKRHKLRGSFIQIINLSRQEKEDKKIKNLERMMYEYEIERRKKEENFRAMTFSENSNFDEIPLPIGINAPEAANTPFLINLPSGIGPQMPAKIAGTLKAGILKKTTGISIKKKHKYPPGPPPGIPPPLFESEEENDEEEQAGQDTREREDNRRRSKRVRFGDRSSKYRDEDDYRERNQEEEDEDYAPVEIPESMLASDQLQKPQQNQPVYSRPVSSISAPQVGPGSLPPAPGMAHPSHIPHHPAYLPPPGYMMQSGPPGSGAIQMAPSYPPGPNPTVPKSTGMANGASFPPDPHPSAIISAEPQVVKPNVNIPSQQTHSTSNESMLSAGPQMRNIRREATRFVPTAVKIQRSLVPPVANPGIGPRLPTGSAVASVAGPTRLVPHPIKNTEMRRSKLPGKGAARTPVGVATTQQPSKSVDEACDEFLKELQGLL